MFDVTADDIAQLNDVDLRELVASFCEFARRGFSPAAVTWGGKQTAAVGGFEVRVALSRKARHRRVHPSPFGGISGKESKHAECRYSRRDAAQGGHSIDQPGARREGGRIYNGQLAVVLDVS